MLRLVGICIGGVAVALAGGLLWGLLFRTNLQVVSQFPWSAVAMLSVIGLSYRVVSRANTRHRLAPPRRQGPWPWIAAAAVAICLVSAVVVGLRVARLPADAFASTIDMRALSTSMQVVRVVMTSSVAAFFEELGFRGLIQGSLERRYGSARSIGITGVLFYLAHFGHGWTRGDLVTVLAVAVPFIIGSALLGALASVTGSLGPSMVAHALSDMVLLAVEWTGTHRLDSVTVAGVDSHFVWWAIVVSISGMACIVLLERLAATAQRSTNDQ
jgi:membrane protease YdiL (CAAX protease family)